MTMALEERQVENWLRRYGMLDPSRREGFLMVDVSGLVELRCFELPQSAEGRTYLGDVIADFFAGQGEILVYVDGWGDTPEYCWDLNLFSRFRQALGDAASIQEMPGQLFRAEDGADLRSMIRLALYFGWGAYVISPSGPVVARVYDDDIGYLWAGASISVDPEKLSWLDGLGKVDSEGAVP